MFVCLSACLLICWSSCLSVCPSVGMSFGLSVCLHVCLVVCQSVCLVACLSVGQTVYLSVCLVSLLVCLCLPVSLYICQSICLWSVGWSLCLSFSLSVFLYFYRYVLYICLSFDSLSVHLSVHHFFVFAEVLKSSSSSSSFPSVCQSLYPSLCFRSVGHEWRDAYVFPPCVQRVGVGERPAGFRGRAAQLFW